MPPSSPSLIQTSTDFPSNTSTQSTATFELSSAATTPPGRISPYGYRNSLGGDIDAPRAAIKEPSPVRSYGSQRASVEMRPPTYYSIPVAATRASSPTTSHVRGGHNMQQCDFHCVNYEMETLRATRSSYQPDRGPKPGPGLNQAVSAWLNTGTGDVLDNARPALYRLAAVGERRFMAYRRIE
ncbi:hypothetical protein C8Q77DRAFT_1076988 [Trametes polyzona]|nr:hypothetical protein C8Q77DRAFT_1076988 [Trametes polyzona]